MAGGENDSDTGDTGGDDEEIDDDEEMEGGTEGSKEEEGDQPEVPTGETPIQEEGDIANKGNSYKENGWTDDPPGGNGGEGGGGPGPLIGHSY